MFSSEITVAPSEPMDPELPLSAPFRVTNAGYFPVYELEFSCVLFEMRFQNNNMIAGRGRWGNLDPRVPSLQPKEVSSAYCKPASLVGEYRVTKLDIGIMVEYRPWWTFWRTSDLARFEYLVRKDGDGRWVPKAVSEPAPLDEKCTLGGEGPERTPNYALQSPAGVHMRRKFGPRHGTRCG